MRRKRANPFAAHHRLKKLCDDTFALIIRLRGGNRCKLCGSSYDTQCAHLIGRTYWRCRWDFGNAWCLCSRCHVRWTHDPIGWRALMVETFGSEEWERRERDARIHVKPDFSVLRFALHHLLVEEARGGAHGLEAQVERLLERHGGSEVW